MVRQERVACLSMSKEETKFYGKKAFKGDNVRLFFLKDNLPPVDGVIRVVTNSEVKFMDGQSYALREIAGFNIYSRGEYVRTIAM